MRPMVWSPLAGGRVFSGDDAQAGRVRAVLQDLAGRYGTTEASVAYAWILRHPSKPHLITGSGRIAALQEAVSALDIRLSAEDWYRVWVASIGHGVA
jgi:predicted oxidoreductase